jgi:tetratricopeptide (TPR) repeat protein
MSENLGSTQPNIKVSSTGKARRGRTILFYALGLIGVLILAVLAGYGSGISVRRQNLSSKIAQQLAEQYQYALVDIEFHRYENAKQRLDFIIENDPAFPGAQEKLTEVLVLMNQPTPSPTPSLTATPDFSGAEEAFARAQQQIAAQDWLGALGTLDEIRKLDPNYQTGQVDGMYYFALRNHGYNLITQGNLEGGIYYFTLAERFGTLDRDAAGMREGARYYLIGASFWELDWAEALAYFNQVAGYGLWDGTFTVSQRIHYATMRYADQLVQQGLFCDAVSQYEHAQTLGGLDEQAQEGYERAFLECYPPAPTIDLTAQVPTLDPGILTPEVPTEETPVITDPAPTDPPPEQPSDTPAPEESAEAPAP